MSDRYTIEFCEGGVDVALTLATGGLALIVQKTIDTLTNDDNHGWDCKITDSITGISVSKWGATKGEAQENAFREIKDEIYQNERHLEQELREAKYQRQQKQQRSSYIKRSTTEEEDENKDADYSGLIKILAYIAVIALIVWLIIFVAIPLIIINTAIIAFVVALTKKDWNKYFYSLSSLGAIYIVMDYNNEWLTKSLVENVSFFAGLIQSFYYLNLVAGLIASYLLVRNLFDEAKPPINSKGEFSKRNLIIMGSTLFVGLFTIGIQKYLDSPHINSIVNIKPISNPPKILPMPNIKNSATLTPSIKPNLPNSSSIKTSISPSQVFSTKVFSGNIGLLNAEYKLKWNSDGTIEGKYYYSNKTNIDYSLKGKDLGSGRIQISQCIGDYVYATGILQLKSNCYQGTITNTEGKHIDIIMCQKQLNANSNGIH